MTHRGTSTCRREQVPSGPTFDPHEDPLAPARAALIGSIIGAVLYAALLGLVAYRVLS